MIFKPTKVPRNQLGTPMIMGTELLKDPINDTIARPYYAIFFLEGHEDLHVSGTSPCYIFSYFEPCNDFPFVKYVDLLSA